MSELGAPDLADQLLRRLAASPAARRRVVEPGRLLHWQGDPVEFVTAIESGAVKLSGVSADGRARAVGLVGRGALLGAASVLLGRPHDACAEVVEAADVLVVPAAPFLDAVGADPALALEVMRRFALEIQGMSGRVRGLTLLSVRDRLKRALIELAEAYGTETPDGIRIDVGLTHQELGEMLAANRSTITASLGELRRDGYVETAGHHVIVRPLHIRILDGLEQAVVEGADDEAARLAGEALQAGIDPVKAADALSRGMRTVDRLLSRDEVDLSDAILSAYAMRAAVDAIEASSAVTLAAAPNLGVVVIGSVSGDIHDIGRTMVAMLLRARGFRVIDLGVDVGAERFVDAVREFQPDIVGISSLMSTTTRQVFGVVASLSSAGLRDRVKVIVGGGAITAALGREMGADGYEPSAHRAAELAWRLALAGRDGTAAAHP